MPSNKTIKAASKTKTIKADKAASKTKTPKEPLPEFLAPKPEAPKVKAKPGPKTGVLAVVNTCPYCGGKAHRKAVQRLKGEAKPYRRMYCADGCGSYHYRDVDTNEVVQVGQGPRVPSFAKPETEEDFLATVAREMGVAPETLKFTAKNDSGRPRALVNCLGPEDIAMLSDDSGNKVHRLHTMLLTVQACIGAYREVAQKISKGK